MTSPKYTEADLAAAVQVEREECAKIAEKSYALENPYGPLFGAGSSFAAEHAAKMIRSRPSPAIDVIGVVREYVEALDAWHRIEPFSLIKAINAVSGRINKALAALRALVDGKGEGKVSA